MGTQAMSQIIKQTIIVLSDVDSEQQKVFHLENLSKVCHGFYPLSDNSIIVFTSSKSKYFIFEKDHLYHVKDQTNESYKKKIKSKNIILKDSQGLTFNQPRKDLRIAFLDRIKEYSGSLLTATKAHDYIKDCDDVDKSAISIIKTAKIKEDKRASAAAKSKSKAKAKAKPNPPPVIIEESSDDEEGFGDKEDAEDETAENTELEEEGEEEELAEEAEEEEEGTADEPEDAEEEELDDEDEAEPDELDHHEESLEAGSSEEDEPEDSLGSESRAPFVISQKDSSVKEIVERRTRMNDDGNRILEKLANVLAHIQKSPTSIHKKKEVDPPPADPKIKPKAKAKEKALGKAKAKSKK